VGLCHDIGLEVYCGFILGHPWDNIGSVVGTIEFADRLEPDYVGFSVMCPYPGTKVREIALMEGGILSDDYSKYRSNYIVYRPPGLDGFDMMTLKNYAEGFFYTRTFRRLFNQFQRMFNREGWKPKVDFLYRMIRWYLPIMLYWRINPL
jgi:radical SAM superfamily enzyme YgiQ (UPF0313 family)